MFEHLDFTHPNYKTQKTNAKPQSTTAPKITNHKITQLKNSKNQTPKHT
jgi:hypothetical protein